MTSASSRTLPNSVFELVFRLSRIAEDRLGAAYATFGLSLGEVEVLAALRCSGAPYTLAPRQLCEAVKMTTGGMTGRLDRLERAGLLRRSPDPHDRRALRVTMTDEGMRVIDEALDAGLTTQAGMLSALNAEESPQLAKLLQALVTAMDA